MEQRTRHRRVIVALSAALIIATFTPMRPLVMPASSATTPLYYLSLGDSLAEGYQPGYADASETLHGFSNRVITDLVPAHDLILENFGCGGITTTQMMESIGCSPQEVPLNGAPYPSTTQLAAAVNFITAHQGQIALVTVAIGGNDIVQGVPLAEIRTNIETIAAELRTAAGPAVPIIGVGYPDHSLQSWLQGGSSKLDATRSVTQWRDSFDPMFVAAYATSNIPFVNTAADFGTFDSFKKYVTLSPYGRIPIPVARVCELTWVCATSGTNYHPTNLGYSDIASAVAETYLALDH